MEMNKFSNPLTDSELTGVSGGTGEPAAKFSVGQRVTIGASGLALDYGTVSEVQYTNGSWQYKITTDSGELTDWLDEASLRSKKSESSSGSGVIMR